MYWTYILYSDGFNRFYVGMTTNLEVRLKTHNSCQVKSTKAFVPWKIIYFEEFGTRIEARTREKYLKSAAGRKWRKNKLGM